MDMDFTGRTAIVTGAARGIGRDIAEALLSHGASVALVDILDEVRQTAGELGEKTRGYTADVTDHVACKNLVKAIGADFGSVDILVNNAGITRDTLLARMSPEDFDQVMKVNLYGTFYLCQAVARPMMKARYGRIVNIASVIGLHGNAGQANYAASKGGVIALTKSTARELASRGVSVNAIAPGFIATAMTEKLPDDVREQMRKAIPLGRLGETSDVSGAVLFLASDLAGYITGQVLVVDGGMFI